MFSIAVVFEVFEVFEVSFFFIVFHLLCAHLSPRYVYYKIIVIVYCICAGGICTAYIRNFILYYNIQYTNNDIHYFIYNIAIIIIII